MPFFSGTADFYTDGGVVGTSICAPGLSVGEYVEVTGSSLNDGIYQIISLSNCGVSVLNFPNASFLSETSATVSMATVTPATSTASSTPILYNDFLLVSSLIIFLLSFYPLGLFFSLFNKRSKKRVSSSNLISYN